MLPSLNWRPASLLTITLACGFVTSSRANPIAHSSHNIIESVPDLPNLDEWIADEADIALDALLENIHPPDTLPGVVVASPSRKDPDYFYHWTRDAALVLSVAQMVYEHGVDNGGAKDTMLENILWNYARFEQHLQTVPNPSSNIAEPKWNVDGTAYTLPWGRPQNDGPALRAQTLTLFAQSHLRKHQNTSLITSLLYDSRFPSSSLIKNNLEFTSHNWQEDTVDLWEEIRGTHFYTLMVQHSSLVHGSRFAEEMGDIGAARWYAAQSRKIASKLEEHWSPEHRILQSTLSRTGGIGYKSSNLDVSILLASLHTDPPSLFDHPRHPFMPHPHFLHTPYPPWSDEVLSTAMKLDHVMSSLYPINNITNVNDLPIANAIGRYPEDRYDGIGTSSLGNPWFLTTLAYAEVLYRTAVEWSHQNWIPVTDVTLDLLKWIGAFHPNSTNPHSHTAEIGKYAISRVPVRRAHSPVLFDWIIKHLGKKADAYFRRVQLHALGRESGKMAEQINRVDGKMQGARSLTWSHAAFVTAVVARDKFLGSLEGEVGEGMGRYTLGDQRRFASLKLQLLKKR
ncbi:Glucoamylase, intracellular sporulation-specific [Rhizophlyctis rosea]|uniref:glucan 1,4-alpha-glucosidase n=1 Tax=Rhizophlyctis rosea TaxID=64517 RepID=A0AAD5X5A2_9FUNG|nr:Glucoamylase, intracellular sporulation-specific [Rhizophlyctis rosea]